MSEHVRLDTLPLFAPAADPKPAALDALEERQAAFLGRVRALVAGHYAGSGTAISADDVHRIMERYGIGLPAGASPNLMGTLFSGWDRAHATGQVIRSKRKGSNGNLLRTWEIR